MTEPVDPDRWFYEGQEGALILARHESFKAFDQAILSLSSGALVVSLAFISDVVPLAEAVGLGHLRGSWVLFAASILFTVGSFLTSRWAIERQLSVVREALKDGKAATDHRNPWMAWTEALNLLAGVTFLAALGFTVSFVWINL